MQIINLYLKNKRASKHAQRIHYIYIQYLFNKKEK